MLKISVITPSFNQGKFIGRCLDSVISQRGNFKVEHIILDNCSTDSTQKILSQYKKNHENIEIYIFTESDNGQTSAINKGFSLATGEIVCWLNTDEYYSENALQSVVDYFERNPSTDILFGDCNFVNECGVIVKRKREFFFSKNMLLYYGCYIPSCSTFVKRCILDKNIFLDPTFKVNMDFDWYMRLADAGFKFDHIKNIIASFTWHDTNISSNFKKRRLQERYLVQNRHSFFNKLKPLDYIIYFIARYYWIILRNIMRIIKYYEHSILNK